MKRPSAVLGFLFATAAGAQADAPGDISAATLELKCLAPAGIETCMAYALAIRNMIVVSERGYGAKFPFCAGSDFTGENVAKAFLRWTGAHQNDDLASTQSTF